ncbi:MAG: adenylate/guanylate cyclase domain-containing protein [Myxococcaceae bacterium]
MFRPRLTLGVVFWASAAGLLGLAIGLSALIFQKSKETVDIGAGRLRDSALMRTSDTVTSYMGGAKKATDQLVEGLASGDCPLEPADAIQSCLLSKLISNPDLDSVGFTHAQVQSDDDDGLVFAPSGRWSLDVYRADQGATSALCIHRLSQGPDGGFVDGSLCRPPEQAYLPARFVTRELGDAGDPTDGPFFTTPARRDSVQTSDLFPSPHDATSNQNKRRFVVSFMHSVHQPDGGFLGVVHVDLVFDRLSQLVRDIRVNPPPVDAGTRAPKDDFHVFLVDGSGQFISGFAEEDAPVEQEDAYRVDPGCYPAPVRAAVKPELISELTPDHPVDTRLDFEGRTWLASFLSIPDTQGWAVGVVGPEDFYTAELAAQRRTALIAIFSILAVFAIIGLLALRAIRRSLDQVQLQTDRISRFEFGHSEVRSPFADVRDALTSIERAKTAVRAMGKYVPLDLVKRLFKDNVEPVAGGELREITLMFSDIEGFTTLVEKEPPERLAQWLGQYLSTMTGSVHATHGTVDKFIGDAVMALWNAPSTDDEHVLNACRGVLACIDATQKLFASREWEGRPALVTRFGLHVGSAMVGHFGAPDRLSYTAIGDSVNLASRLEGLNKEYGTQVLVSEAVWRRAQHLFAFRRLDRVAVKGKAEAIEVYELLGEKQAQPAAHIQKYESALTAYFARDFTRAAKLLEDSGDAPSRVLHIRCLAMADAPPPRDWNGVWVLHTK